MRMLAFFVLIFGMLPVTATATIWPIKAGARWTYEITNIGFSPACAPGESSLVIHDVREESDAMYFTGTTECGYRFENKVVDDRFYIPYQDIWYLFLDKPQDQHTYVGFRSLYKYESIATFDVPAGTFTNCWLQTQLVSYQHQRIYCDGVGKIWEKHIDMSGSGFEIKLKNWSADPG
jgi:hypothetical protein